MVELFLELGADLDLMDNIGCTALHEAIYYRHNSIATMLINQGASPFLENMQGTTPMDIVCKNGHNARLLRQMEDRAIYCGWVEQKVRRLGIGHEWCRRWIVIAQRLSFHRRGGVHTQPHVRTMLLSYQNLDSLMATCKCFLDQARASDEHASPQRVLRNRKMLHAIRVYLRRGHPAIRGAATDKTMGRITMYFRPVNIDENSAASVSDLMSYINWASGLNSVESIVDPVAPIQADSGPHWAFEPPQLLHTENSNNTVDTRLDSTSVDEAAISIAAPEASQQRDNEGGGQGLKKECLICMDNKIEVVFCHQNETYVKRNECIKYRNSIKTLHVPAGDALWHAKTAMIGFRELTARCVDRKSQEEYSYTAYRKCEFIRKISSCHLLAFYRRYP